MDQLTLAILLVVTLLAMKCGAQTKITSDKGEEFHRMLFYNGNVFVGGNKYVFRFNTNLFIEQKVAICSENCDANVNKILLINSASNELIECSSGDNGLCKVRDVESLTVKRNSSFIVTTGNQVEQGLTVSTEKDYPAQAQLNENSTHIAIATTPSSGFPVNVDNKSLCISMWTLNPFSKSSDLYLTRDNYIIRYVASFRTGHYSYFFTNQIQLQNQTNMVSKVVRINYRFAKPFQSYTDFVIECQDNTGKAYTILKMAILIQINGIPYVAATFTNSSDDDSILCTKPLADINKQAFDSWINFMKRTCSNARFESYLEQSLNCNLTGLAALLLTEDLNSTNPFYPLFFYSVDWTVLQMNFQASSFFQEGYMVTMHDSVVNEQHVLTVGTTYGLLLQFVSLDGKYRRYNTFKIADSPILGLYQHNDSEHTMLVMTKNELYKYASTRCLEYPGSHCVKSGVMEGRNPHCGWCIYEQRASLKCECSCKTTVCWLSSLTSCITLDLEPRGAQASTGTVDIQLTTSLSLPDGPLYQYLCRWQSGAVKNATRVRSKFTCRMDNTNITNNIQLTLELGVKVINTDSFVHLTEAPFLLYSCSNFEKCGECTLTVGANCTWCPVKGLCRQTSATCSHAVTSSNRTCPQLANHYDQLYLPSGINRSLTINVTNDVLTQYNNVAFRLVTDAVGLNSSCTASSSQLTCLVNVSVNHSKAKNMISMQYSSSANGWVYLDDNHNNKVTIYNCTKLAEEGCNYCKALNSSIYKCAWDSSAHICKYNDNRGARENAICPSPLINEISPEDGPYFGSIITTIMGREFGVIEFKDIDHTSIVVSGKSCSPMQDISFVPPDEHDFELRVRTGITCKALGSPSVNRTSLIISYQRSILAADFKPLILKNSTITRVYPEFGPRAGGTKITVYGENLGIGNRMLDEFYLVDQGKSVELQSSSIYEMGGDYVIIGTIPIRAENSTIGNASFYVRRLNDLVLHNDTVSFTFLDNPVVTDIYPTHGYLSGGTVLTITGENLNHAKLPIIFIRGYEQNSEQCIIDDSSTKAFCKVPEAPQDLKQKLETRRRRRATACVGCQEVEIVVKLDGVERSFALKYYHDPSLSKFNNGMKLFNEDQHFLTVEGDNLTLLATSDVQITVGIEECRVVDVSNTFMRCAAPRKQPKPGVSGAEIPEVNVTIGNIRATLGYLKYEVAVKQVALIVGASVGAAVLVIVIVIVVVCVATRKRRANTKANRMLAKKMKKELKDVEFEDKIRALPEENQPRMKIEHENDSLK